MYTLVQHSGFVANHDPSFRRAVELRHVDGDAAVKRVAKAGGYLFYSYGEASKAEQDVNYQPDNTGMIPCVAGSFSGREVEGQAIYPTPR
tara:strand:+ start:695 stop:964 length:270 start_codon:yes stop_codon:yes gene_type:complete